MKTQSTEPLTARVLFGADAALPDATAFLGTLNARLERFGVTLHSDGQDDDGTLLFSDARVSVTFHRAPNPVPADDLADALAAPALAFKPAGLGARTASHARHVGLSVASARDAPPLPWHMRLVFLHRAILALFEISEPDTVYLPLSDMLFDRSEIDATRDMSLPLPLCLQPIPIAAPDIPVISGVLPPMGLVVVGSERFCGKPLVLAPSPLPLPEGLALVTRLLRDHAAGVRVLEDGAEFDDLGQGGVFIRHSSGDDGAPGGRILIGLGDWPDTDAAHARPMSLAELTPDTYQVRAPREVPPGLLARAARLALTPNGLTLIAMVAAYLVLSHLAAGWIEAQSEMIRSSVGATVSGNRSP